MAKKTAVNSRNAENILSDNQLKFFYEQILLFVESERKSYGDSEILTKKVKKISGLENFDFNFEDYKRGMLHPVEDTFYFKAETCPGSIKRKHDKIVYNWFKHLRNAFAHNYIRIENGCMIMIDVYEGEQTLYAKIQSYEMLEKLVKKVKELIKKTTKNEKK